MLCLECYLIRTFELIITPPYKRLSTYRPLQRWNNIDYRPLLPYRPNPTQGSAMGRQY